MTVDHLVDGVGDRPGPVEELGRLLGVRPAAGGRHPGTGTCSDVLSRGPRIHLEELVIAPPDPEAAQLALRAFSGEVVVEPAASSALVAHVVGPHGTQELR